MTMTHLDTFGNIQSTHWLFHRDSSHPKLKLEGCQKSWMFEAKLSLSWFLLEVLAREKREMWLVWTLKLGMSSKCTHTHTRKETFWNFTLSETTTETVYQISWYHSFSELEPLNRISWYSDIVKDLNFQSMPQTPAMNQRFASRNELLVL